MGAVIRGEKKRGKMKWQRERREARIDEREENREDMRSEEKRWEDEYEKGKKEGKCRKVGNDRKEKGPGDVEEGVTKETASKR